MRGVMQTIQTTSRVSADGLLVLRMPQELANTDVDVTAIVRPSRHAGQPMTHDEWVEFINRTGGSIQDESFFKAVEECEGGFEERDPL